MKKTLLILLAVIVTIGLSAQLSMEDNQILYLSFDDDTELGYNEEDLEVFEETDVDADEGMFGGGALFNGETSLMVFDVIEDWNHSMDFGLSVWLNTSFTGGCPVIGIGTYGDAATDDWDSEDLQGGFGMFFNGDDELGADCSWIDYVGPDGDLLVNDGEWHNIVVTYSAEATTMTLYVDGILYGENDGFDIASGGFTTTDDNLKLGYTSSNFPEGVAEMRYNGLMDDFRLFNITLTADDAIEIFEYEAETGLNEVKAVNTVSVFPNPATDQIRLGVESTRVIIYNVIGGKVLSIENYNGGWITVDNLETGLYFVKTDDSVAKVILK